MLLFLLGISVPIVTPARYEIQMKSLQLANESSCPVGNWTPAPEPEQGSPVAQGRKNPLWLGFAARLTRARVRAGLTRNGLAKLAGCSIKSVIRSETGVNIPLIGLVEKWATALGLSPIWLAFGPDGGLPFRQRQTNVRSRRVELPEAVPRPHPAVLRSRGVAARLLHTRKARRFAISDVSTAANLNPQAVTFIERRGTLPRLDTLEAIARAMGVAPGWLAYGDDEPAITGHPMVPDRGPDGASM